MKIDNYVLFIEKGKTKEALITKNRKYEEN